MGETDAMFSMDVDARGSLSCISFLGRGLSGPAAPASGPSSPMTSLISQHSKFNDRHFL
jgi:hypothetical protein